MKYEALFTFFKNYIVIQVTPISLFTATMDVLEDNALKPLIQRLQSWKSSLSKDLLLDLRSSDLYLRRHLLPSTNIPSTQLTTRWFELPSKEVPFAILESPIENTTDIPNSTWLYNHGWDTPWIFTDDSSNEFWRAVDQLKLAWEEGPMSDLPLVQHNISLEIPPKPNLLFSPSLYFAKVFPQIQSRLQSNSNSIHFHCLDLGCGSGRDIAYLLSRAPLPNTNKMDWQVTGVDSNRGALERTLLLAISMSLQVHLYRLCCAKITAEGKWRLLLQSTSPMSFSTNSVNPPVPLEPILSKAHQFAPGLSTHLFFNNYLNPPIAGYHLLLTIRFLSRPLLPVLPTLLAKGGFWVISTFVDDPAFEYVQPGKSHRLEVDEVHRVIEDSNKREKGNWLILWEEIQIIDGGRPVWCGVVWRKS